jgi:hypothetical protein
MNIFVVTHLEITIFGEVSFIIDKWFKTLEEAEQYCKQQTGRDKNNLRYVVNEVPGEE